MASKSNLKQRLTVSFYEFRELKRKQRELELEQGERPSCLIGFSRRSIDIARLIRIRVFLSISFAATIIFISCLLQNYLLVLALLGFVAVWAETVYLCIWRDARDFYWFSVTNFIGVLIFMGTYWTITSIRNELGDVECKTVNISDSRGIGRCLGLEIEICQLLYLLTALFLFLVVLSKWYTPFSKKLNLKTNSDLSAVFLSAGADFYDLIDYNNFAAITDVIGTEPILIVGCLSLIQFSFNLTATKRMRLTVKNRAEFWIDFLLSTDAWALILVFLTQDLPSLILRIYILVKCGFFVHPSLFFFGLKNILMAGTQFFRFSLLLLDYGSLVQGPGEKQFLKHWRRSTVAPVANSTLEGTQEGNIETNNL